MSPGNGNVLEYIKHYAFTVLICLAIATLLWALGVDAFVESVVFSLCIGLSIHTITIAGIVLFHPSAVWKLWILSIPFGVAAGLSLGAWINQVPAAELIAGGSPMLSLIISLIASYVFYSYYSMIEMRDLLRRREIAQVTSEKRLVETQLKLLQSQIEPHFLFNTLSHVVSLIGSDAERAEVMLRKLTQFLRVSLRRSRSERATLRDELDLIDDYLAILKIRMDERLTYTIHVDVDDDAFTFPPLILQPLVENAVVHGIEPLEEGGTINVSVTSEHERLVVRVADSGRGLGTGEGGTGMGISNVQERLRLLYGEEVRMQVSDLVPHGLQVTIRIPMAALDDE